MSNSEYIRDFLFTCPVIQQSDAEMCVSFIGDTPLTYSIEGIPTKPVIKKYLNGDTVRQFTFGLVGRYEMYTDKIRVQNDQSYEELAMWLEQQTKQRMLPDMGNGATAQKIEAIGAQFVSERDQNNNSALYVMQCALTYYQKGRR